MSFLFVMGDDQINKFGGNELHSKKYINYLRIHNIEISYVYKFKEIFNNNLSYGAVLNQIINLPFLFYFCLKFNVVFFNQPHYGYNLLWLSSYRKFIIRCAVENPFNGLTKLDIKFKNNIYWILPRPFPGYDLSKKIIIPNLFEFIFDYNFFATSKSIVAIGNFLYQYKGIDTLLYLANTNIIINVLGKVNPNLKHPNLITFDEKNFLTQYKNFGVMILPSYTEGVSNALLQSMMFGYIVIARDIISNNFLIVNKINGFLFSKNEDILYILDNINNMSNDEINKIRKSAKETVFNYLNYKNFSTLKLIIEKL